MRWSRNEFKNVYIYLKRNSNHKDYSQRFREVSSYYSNLLGEGKDLTEQDLKDLILYRSNGIADAGRWGSCNKEQFDSICSIWDGIYVILKNFKLNNEIKKEEYQQLLKIVQDSCGRNKFIIVNRILASFFPEELTATCKNEDFNELANYMVENFENYPQPQNNWVLDNISFMKYCNDSFEADVEFPIPVFSWKLLEIIKNKEIENIISEGAGEMLESKKFAKLLTHTHNLILHGAPGTGKTHLARDIAKAMRCSDNEIGFVQFHPSYDYTDFVEGLRPMNDGNSEQIGFERKDGVFKKFCERAILSSGYNDDILKELNDNPTVWKVSLEGTGDNPTRKDCLENGYIRIGWKDYGDVADFSKFEGYTEHGGSNVLVAFQSKMKIGDIVLSCWSSTEIDAIGIVTGEYEYRSDGGDYPRYRNVKWLVKGIRENIVVKNHGKTLTLASVYKLSISIQDIIDTVKKYSKSKVSTENTPFVFIIDEINRGEMSKIFGELFFSIDPGYRGKAGLIQTQYQNLISENNIFYNGFYVPENVYIIGTMNDIDRNVESMDFAFRRRFTFKEIKTTDTQQDILAGLDDSIREDAIRRMNSLNDEISNIEGLSSAYHIGGAYFLKLKDLDNDFEKLWEYHLEGLLREYLRGMEDAESEIKKLKEAYENPNDDLGEQD